MEFERNTFSFKQVSFFAYTLECVQTILFSKKV